MKFNYFYINKSFFHQIKGTAIETKFSVVGNNLVVAYIKIKLFALLPEVYPQDFIDFLLQNYFRFLDGNFHKLFKNFDIKQFYNLVNCLENPCRTLNFLDIQLKVVNNTLAFEIYFKTTNSFNYLTYSSCHPSHAKNNIALVLVKRIINIVIDNRVKRLSKLKKYLIEKNHLLEIIDNTFTKYFQPKSDKTRI